MSKDIRNVAKKLNKELKELGVGQNVRDLVRDRFRLVDEIHNEKMKILQSHEPPTEYTGPVSLEGYFISVEEVIANSSKITISPSDMEIRLKFSDRSSDFVRDEISKMASVIKKHCSILPWTVRSRISYQFDENSTGFYRLNLESNSGKLRQIVKYYPKSGDLFWQDPEQTNSVNVVPSTKSSKKNGWMSKITEIFEDLL